MKIFAFICFVTINASGDVVTYPGIPEKQSDQYLVQVVQDGRSHNSFVYQTRAKWRSNRIKSTSWTTFSFSGPAIVRVTKLQGALTHCKILPSSYGIAPKIQGNTASFRLDRPRKVSVECNDDISHAMLVFADPMETDLPRPGDPGVVYFGPGLHRIGERYRLRSGRTVVLAGGSYVIGKFILDNADDVTIRGRGVLSGEDWTPKRDHMITARNSDRTQVEGITIVDADHFNISLRGRDQVVRNVKMISWYFSTDGVGIGERGLVEDCFFKVNDDALKLYHSGQRVRDCVIWQMENGAPFQISWNMPSDAEDIVVRNIDIIRVEHQWDNENEAVFDAIHGGRGHMHDYLFEDIRVENAHWRLVNLTIAKNDFSPPDSWGKGRISRLYFRNITVDGPMQRPNTLRGWDGDHRISDVVFENVKVDGVYWRSAEDGNFQIDPETTANIRFIVTADGP